jgi:predicted site-specific integrase-resolvase
MMAGTSKFYTATEVGDLYGVSGKTANRWAKDEPPGLPSITTPGGHFRYPRHLVDADLRGEDWRALQAAEVTE